MTRKYGTSKDMMKVRCVPQWAREIISEVAFKHGVTTNMIMMDFRNDTAVLARQESIYLIKEKKPALSSKQIGKWFEKDHTTILYSLTRHALRVGSPLLSKYRLDPEERAERRRLQYIPTGRKPGRPKSEGEDRAPVDSQPNS